MNRTPLKLKRAVSHVFSPFMRDSSGDLQGRRLASTLDLTVSRSLPTFLFSPKCFVQRVICVHNLLVQISPVFFFC